MATTRHPRKELDSREFLVQILVRRSDNRQGGWVAFALELGIVAQGDSLREVIDEAVGVCNTFIVDALNDGNEPTEVPSAPALFAEAARIRRDGMPLILPRRAYSVLDEQRISLLLLPMTFQVVRHVAVPQAEDAQPEAHFEMAA